MYKFEKPNALRIIPEDSSIISKVTKDAFEVDSKLLDVFWILVMGSRSFDIMKVKNVEL